MLLTTTQFNTAEACRELGISVGDTIVGRESYANGWSDAKLTLLWVGKKEAVWSVQRRTDKNPEWTEAEECTNWVLNCRPWEKVE